MRVLVVDDDHDIRETLQEFLEDHGFEVAGAASGIEGLRRLGSDPLPCVVIVDIIMPDLDGNQMVARMQEDPRLSRVPVIVSTSDPSRAPSGVPVVKKPVDLQHLLSAVRRRCDPEATRSGGPTG